MEESSVLGKRRNKDWAFFLVAILVTALDQLTKFFVRWYLYPGQSIPQQGFFRITYVTNTGGAFGLFANQTLFIVVMAAFGIGAILLYYWYPPSQRGLIKASLGLQLGGAVGNLVDRLRYGEVTDFLDVGFWPVFNLADSAIVIGVMLLLWFLLFPLRREKALKHDHRASPKG